MWRSKYLKSGITFFKIVRDDNLFIRHLYATIIISLELQIKRLIFWLQYKTQGWFILRHCCLYCARFRLSLRQSESSLSICRIASSKFIPWTKTVCFVCRLGISRIHRMSRFISRISRIDIDDSVKRVQFAPVRHTLINDVHRNRVRLILNVHHHVIHVHVFPLIASASPQLLGKDRKKRVIKLKGLRGKGEIEGNIEMGLMLFSRSWIPRFGVSIGAPPPSVSISLPHRIRSQMKDRAFPGPYFLFPGEPKAQMGCFHVPDADLLRPLRLDASRYRPSGTQVFR